MLALCLARICGHTGLGGRSEIPSEDRSLEADKKFITFGDHSSFALQVRLESEEVRGIAPERSVNSWGEWRLWVAKVNLCALQLDTKDGLAEVHGVRWFLAPLFRWIVANWMPLLHEKRLPPGGRVGDSRPRSARAAYLAMLESAGDDLDRFLCWQEWAERHALRAASEGGILPDVFFQRMEDEIEFSWGDRVQPGADPARFIVEDGIARAPVDVVARTFYDAVEWFCAQEQVCGSEWETELRRQWRETRALPAETALSWFLDSSPKPGSLTKTFKKAIRAHAELPELSGRCWLGNLAPEVAMFGDLAPDISKEAAANLLAEYFNAKTNGGMSASLAERFSDEPAWSTSSPWHNGYSCALDVLDDLDPNPKSATTNIDAILDALGVTVKNVGLGEQGPRGVAFAGRDLQPTILVNEDDSKNKYRGRRFTLAHELCHILFDRSRARSLAHSSTPWASPSVEQRANAFAAMLLMPPSRASRPPAATGLADLKHGIGRLADRIQVSRVALTRHLSNMNEVGPQELDYLLGERAREV